MPMRRLLPEHDAQGLGGLAEDRLVLGQQRSRRREALERRRAERLPAAMPNTRPTSTSGCSALCSSRKTVVLLAGFVDHGILEERQRRQARQAVVGQHLRKSRSTASVTVAATSCHSAWRPWTGRRSNNGRARYVCCAHRVAQPLLVPLLPFRDRRDVKGSIEEITRPWQVVAFCERVRHP